MQSKATTVAQYLAELPADRRTAIAGVRKVILANLDKDYEEGMQYGMIGYVVPHRLYSDGYHTDPKQPLSFACLASQKNYMTLYLMSVYADGKWFPDAWAKTGKKLDMGKSCIRFKKLDDLALDVVGEAIRRMPVKRYIEFYETCLKTNLQTRTKRKPAKMVKCKLAKPAKKAAARPKAARKKKAKR